MALKMVVPNLDDVDSNLHALYKEVGGEFVLEVEDAKPIAEFNKVHVALTKERNDHKATKTQLLAFDGFKPNEVKASLDRLAELELTEGKVDDTKINTLVETRIKSKLVPLERQVTDLSQQLQDANGKIETYAKNEVRSRIDAEVVKAAKAAGVQTYAIEDALLLGSTIFRLDETGSVTVGENSSFTEGLAPKDWIAEVQKTRPHWFGETQGGGSRGSKGTGAGANPFMKDSWNITEQGKIVASDPIRADKLAKAAGVSVGDTEPVR